MFLLIILALILPELYIWHFFLRHLHWSIQVVFWMPYIATGILMLLFNSPIAQAWMFRWAMLMIICFSTPKLLFAVISLFGLPFRTPHPTLWHVANIAAATLAATTLCIIIYGLTMGWKRLTVNEIELRFADLPEAFDGYRIVQLSDMHIGTYHAAPEKVSEIVEKTNSLHPDLICFTGDLINIAPSELDIFDSDLAKLKARDGVFSIMGNHDYCTYNRNATLSQRRQAIRSLQQREKRYGWDLLLNEHRIIHRGADSIAIVGVENSSRPPFPDYGNLTKALATHQTAMPDFKILLSHDPTHWRREVTPKTDIQLQLSGHTHATQFRLFGWTPSQHIYDEYAGLYELDGSKSVAADSDTQDPALRKLFICTGTGGNVSFRFGVWPEIVVITLKKG